MGLFGMRLFGYNEKTYSKNSEKFKERIQNIMYDAADRGVSTFGIGKSLSELTIMIDKLQYKKGGTEYEAIDAEIDKIQCYGRRRKTKENGKRCCSCRPSLQRARRRKKIR